MTIPRVARYPVSETPGRFLPVEGTGPKPMYSDISPGRLMLSRHKKRSFMGPSSHFAQQALNSSPSFDKL